MSILVKGMEMPTFCERCPMYSEDYWSCNAIPREFPDSFYPWYDNRPDWCPLEEVADYPQVPGITPTVIKEEKKALTKRDIMLACNDEGIADFICSQIDDCSKCIAGELCTPQDGRANGLVKWLKQEAT